MRRAGPATPRAPLAVAVLRLLLVGALLAPLPARLWGSRFALPWGLSLGELAGIVVVVAVGALARGAMRAGRRGLLRTLMAIAAAGLVATLLALLTDRRANAFYTTDALFEGMAALLLAHLVGALLALPRARDVATTVTAAAFAERMVALSAWLVGGFWLLTALQWREAALTLMLVAGALSVLALILRIPDAVRGRRSRRAALLLAGILTTSCAAPRPAGVAQAPRRELAGPGCPVQPIDVAPRAAPAMIAPRAAPAAPAPRDMGELALRLNIPAFRLDVRLDSVVDRSFGVAVGTRRYRTPVGEFAVRRIVWNPWWVPPDSPWAWKDTVTPPGPANPMGRVKLLLGGPYYVHGSPHAASIGSAASHGCIRMRNEDAVALASYLQAHLGIGPDEQAIVAILADTASLAVDLPRPVRFDIVYEVAELRGDTLLLHPDVYRRAPAGLRTLALLALARAGHDSGSVNRTVLAAALRRARRRGVAIPLDSLLDVAARRRTPLVTSP